MPAVTRGDDDRVNVIARQDSGHVVVSHTIRVPVMAVGLALNNFAALFLRIRNGNELTVLVLKETVLDLALVCAGRCS